MPKITHIQEQTIRRHIRDAMAIDPLISLMNIQKSLEKKLNRTISIVYIMRLVKKIGTELLVDLDRESVEKRVSQMRESNRIIREGLLKIEFPGDGGYVENKDKIRALETIAKIDHSMAKIEMEFGIFSKKTIEKTNDGFDDEKLEGIIKAFENWGVSPPQMRKIEVKVQTIDIKTKTNESADKTTTTTTSSNIIPAITGAGMVSTE